MEEIVMPRLSDTMERGTIARWLVHEGDTVKEGDILAEIETDKATMELSAYDEGVLLRILVQDGESAELGAPIAVVGAPGEDASGFSAAASNEAAEATAEADGSAGNAATAVAAPAAPAAPGSSDLKASPVARRIASDAGFDLRVLAGKGSGPDGRIVRVDVERALAGGTAAPAAGRGRARRAAPAAAPAPAPARPTAPAPAGGTVIDPSPMLRAVARRMSESKSQVPHFYLQCEIDMGKALALREELNAELAETGVKLDGERPDRARLGAGPARSPAVPPLVDRRQAAPARRGARRDRRRPRRGTDRPRDPRRRLAAAARAGRRGARSGRAGTLRLAQAERDRGRHLQRLEPRHARHHELPGDHQPARAGHPRRGQRGGARARRRRPGHRCGP